MALTSYKKFFDISKIIADIRGYLPNFNEELFMLAFEFAKKSHEGQLRKDGKTPYIVHPVETVNNLIKIHADEDVLISALLHDVPEDTKIDIMEIREKFGDKIAFLIEGMTKLSKLHYQNNMSEREVESLKKMLLHSAKDLRVILIKLADRLHNMQTLEFVKPEKQARIAHETLEIYVPIANLLGIYEFKEPLEDLCFKSLFPSEYERLKIKLEKLEDKNKDISEIFIKDLNKPLKKVGIKAEIFQKKRTLFREYKKLSIKGLTIDDLSDRIFVQVIVKDISECYQVLGVIHGLFIPSPKGFKDFIANPKVNGYQAIHTKVFGIQGILTEIQIQSRDMYKKSRYGIASAFFETSGSDREYIWNGEQYDWFRKIFEIDQNQKFSKDFIENLKGDILQDRIFVFTPKGQCVDLPVGATTLDFAYAIHSDVGDHAVKADINGKIEPLITSLKTGDVVRIVTSHDSNPQLGWLPFLKTNNARTCVLLYLKNASKQKKLIEGLKIFQKELDTAGMGFYRRLNFKWARKLIKEKMNEWFHNWEELYIAIGEGRIKAIDVVKALKKPIKQDMVLGRKGIKFNLKITGRDRMGLLGDVSKVLYKYVYDVTYVKAKTVHDKAYANIQIVVGDMDAIGYILDELSHIEGIENLHSIPSRDLLWFHIVTTIAGFLWIIQPVIIAIVSRFQYAETHPYVTHTLMGIELLCLFAVLAYLNRIVKRYFPVTRGKTSVWVMSFLIITVATATLLFELVYFKLQYYSLPTFMVTLAIYIYLLLSYIDSRRFRV